MAGKRIAAVVLSGGKSERMGTAKALLQYRGVTFLDRILSSIRSAGIQDVAVVAGHHHHLIATEFPNSSITFNAGYEQGMSTSVQAGLRVLPGTVDGALIFLVD